MTKEERIDAIYNIFTPVFNDVKGKLKHQYNQTPDLREMELKLEELHTQIIEEVNESIEVLLKKYAEITMSWAITTIKEDGNKGGDTAKKKKKEVNNEQAEVNFDKPVTKPASRLFSQLKTIKE